MSLNVGDVWTVTGNFTNAADEPADPTTVTLIIVKPDGTQTTVTPDQLGLGYFGHDIAIDQPGAWRYAFKGVGDPTTAEAGEFYVQRSVLDDG